MMMPEDATVLYADCHVRVYHGKKQLPKHYVAGNVCALPYRLTIGSMRWMASRSLW